MNVKEVIEQAKQQNPESYLDDLAEKLWKHVHKNATTREINNIIKKYYPWYSSKEEALKAIKKGVIHFYKTILYAFEQAKDKPQIFIQQTSNSTNKCFRGKFVVPVCIDGQAELFTTNHHGLLILPHAESHRVDGLVFKSCVVGMSRPFEIQYNIIHLPFQFALKVDPSTIWNFDVI